MSIAKLLERFHLDSSEALEWQVKYNVAPSLDVPVIVQLGDKPKLMLMKWGLTPPWQKEGPYKPLINLRTDTVSNRPGFRRILETTRCLVPIDGFFEWQTEEKAKRPHRYVMNSGEIFCLGALYGARSMQNGKTDYTFTLMTTDANNLVGQIHDRMPVIVPRSHEAAWLNPRSKFSDYALCLSPYPSQEMRSYEVSDKINSGKVDSPDLIAPLKPGSNPGLF
jgi:putative SOS response-associated peptidase YedK